MITTIRWSIRLAAVMFFALPISAVGQSPGGATTTPTLSGKKGPITEDQLIERYQMLAGSEANAKSLVNGLRHGTEVTLTAGRAVIRFTPPTGNMGLGNVDVALAFTEAQFNENGIKPPTKPTELQAVLMGGEVVNRMLKTRVKVPGILQLRASGKGWGEIADMLGYKLH